MHISKHAFVMTKTMLDKRRNKIDQSSCQVLFSLRKLTMTQKVEPMQKVNPFIPKNLALSKSVIHHIRRLFRTYICIHTPQKIILRTEITGTRININVLRRKQ